MPSSSARILVVAATDRELANPEGWDVLRCGVGPIEAAIATASALAQKRPRALLHVGIAGARTRSTIMPPSIVIGTESYYEDSAIPEEWAPRRIVPSQKLVAASHAAISTALLRPIGTSARVGGSAVCDVEAMEGFGLLRAAERAGVPAIEVRAISNLVEEGDRRRWMFEEAFEAISVATPRLVEALLRCVS